MGLFDRFFNKTNANSLIHSTTIQLLEKFKMETIIPSIKLTFERKGKISITDSKLGGYPYLPKDFTYPVSSKGHPLKLLAQLNFSQLPALVDFPSSGILQFYVLPNCDVGLPGRENLSNQDSFRVIYHKDIAPNECMKYFPKIELIDDGYGAWFPFEGEFAIIGSVQDSFITSATYEFDKKLAEFCEKNDMKSFYELYSTPWYGADKTMSKAEYKEFDKKKHELCDIIYPIFADETHRISGYPYFTQEDPRFYDASLRKYDTLLLQIASEYGNGPNTDEIMWGDAGIANFFINKENLKNLNFADVIYTWDCC